MNNDFDLIGTNLLRFLDQFVQQTLPARAGESVSVMFNEDIRRQFFDAWKRDVQSNSTVPNDFNATVLNQAETVLNINDTVANIDDLEKKFGKWLKTDNPLAKLEDDLIERNCTPKTVTVYLQMARQYTKAHDFAPTFDKQELFSYLKNIKATKANSTYELHRTVLKLWWDVLGYKWPESKRRRHQDQHSIVVSQPPSLTYDQIKDIITRVRQFGTPQQKYYFCLSTLLAPRAGELGAITGSNFSWEKETGILSFWPQKRGLRRTHRIPEEIVPYLKKYSYIAEPMTSTKMDYLFHKWCHELDIKLPKSQKKLCGLTGKVKREKGINWHAFRHTLDTGLIDSGLNTAAIRLFLGWRTKGDGMSGYYYTPNLADLDKSVWKKHPFLHLWTEDL